MLWKNTTRKIKKSLGRYLSLGLIILLGVGFYTGIKESIPNIQQTQNLYYEETALADIKILSPIGFDDEDIAAMKLTGVKKSVGSYSKDVIVDENVIRLHSLEEDINGYQLVAGTPPKKSNECLADANHYKVGDLIKVNEDYQGDLAVTTYKVVGTIHSPIYSTNEFGSSDIGNGKLYSFAFIPKTNFKNRFYTEAYLILDKKEIDVSYSEGYKLKTDKIEDQLKVVKNERTTERVDELIKESNGKLSDKDFWGITWHFQTRDDFVTAYTILDSQYDQVNIIADVIPFFFILIVILMTSNTMTRMITEERGEMGTLLSLGFDKETITKTYLAYVLSATIIGAIVGYFLGTIFLPQLVYNCFPLNFPDMPYHFGLTTFVLSLLISCGLMIYVTVTACSKELKTAPANLLRPEPPKKGKKVLLEKVHFIWDRLSFSSKITVRNISRYRKRGFITFLGAMGCTFMIMLGFALKDSINTVGDKQYNDLFKYDNMLILNSNITELSSQQKELFSGLIKDEFLLNQTAYKVEDKDNTLDVFVVVPENTTKQFNKYFTLRNKKTNQKLPLEDNGVIITPKIQERFDLKVGDKFTIKSLNQETFKVKVAGIAENYVSNYIYMSKEYYNKIFEQDIKYNVIVSNNVKNKNKIATKLLESEDIMSISFKEDLLTSANEAVEGLNSVIVLLVFISSALALTVLYNLTSINISERTREIATLKVLGFTDNESNAYIYRETLILVIVGIIAGLIITPPLHSVIMSLLEVDHMIFLKEIKIQSYIYSACLTLFFALIMLVVTYYKLKKINMIESLKSVE